MSQTRRYLGKPLALAGLVGGLALAGGCQTYPAGFGGMTLPSGQYLKHPPQYFPPDPDFPLQRELDSQQDPAALQQRAAGAGLPNPLGAPPVVAPPVAGPNVGGVPGVPGGAGPGNVGPGQAVPPAGGPGNVPR